MKKKQSGSVLSISLILLTVITIISMMSLQRSGLQTKIIANVQHNENVFHAALSEQEYWYNQYNIAGNANALLFEVIENDGIPLGLDPSRDQGPAIQLQVNTTNTHIPSTANDIVFSVGNDIVSRKNYHFQLNTVSTIQRKPGLTSPQQTGFNFPALKLANNTF
jgi:Tfp pilus assembly protein PilX